MSGLWHKVMAVALVVTAGIVAANMWIVGLIETPDGKTIGSPGGYLNSWAWIDALYTALCGFSLARLLAAPRTGPSVHDARAGTNRLLIIGFAVVVVGCILNLALLELFWLWHFIDGILVVVFLTQAAREWREIR